VRSMRSAPRPVEPNDDTTQREGNGDHETDDQHAGLRRRRDAGNGGRHPDLDPGFERGGWAGPLFENESMTFVDEVYQRADAFLFGRRTCELFAGYWGCGDQPIAGGRLLNGAAA